MRLHMTWLFIPKSSKCLYIINCYLNSVTIMLIVRSAHIVCDATTALQDSSFKMTATAVPRNARARNRLSYKAMLEMISLRCLSPIYNLFSASLLSPAANAGAQAAQLNNSGEVIKEICCLHHCSRVSALIWRSYCAVETEYDSSLNNYVYFNDTYRARK